MDSGVVIDATRSGVVSDKPTISAAAGSNLVSRSF
jgi:hypothetical protein